MRRPCETKQDPHQSTANGDSLIIVLKGSPKITWQEHKVSSRLWQLDVVEYLALHKVCSVYKFFIHEVVKI